MHSNATSKNVSWLHCSWPTLILKPLCRLQSSLQRHKVRVDSVLSDWFVTIAGVVHDCVLSTLLFSTPYIAGGSNDECKWLRYFE